MDDQVLTQLNRMIDEHHRLLCERLDDLAETIQSVHAALVARLEAHETYHQRCEHKWGVYKLVERYPLRFIGLSFLGAIVLTSIKPESEHWLSELARYLVSFLK